MTIPMRSPFRRIDQRRFDRYVRTALKTRRFDPTQNRNELDDDFLRSSLLSAWGYFGASHHTRRQDGERLRLYVGYADVIKPNAFAEYVDGTHLVAIHSSLGAAMLELALFCCAQASFFHEVGDPSTEVSPELPEGAALSFLLIDLTRAGETSRLPELSGRIMPRDPERFLLAHWITQMLLRFAWFHEFYHCANGHVGLGKALGWLGRLQEIPDEAVQPPVDGNALAAEIGIDETDIAHCFELDADRSALWTLAELQTTGGENLEGIKAMPLRMRMKVVLFSAFLMTHFFAEHARRAGRPDSSTHPDAYVRLHNLVRTTASHLLDLYPETLGVFREVLAEFERLGSRVPGLFSAKRLINDLRSSSFQPSVDRLGDTLTKLRNPLAPCSYHMPRLSRHS